MSLSKSFPKSDHAIGFRGQAETVYTVVNKTEHPRHLLPLLDGCVKAYKEKGAVKNMQVFLAAYFAKYDKEVYVEPNSNVLREMSGRIARAVKASADPVQALSEITQSLNKRQKRSLLDTMLIAAASTPASRLVDALMASGAKTHTDNHAAVMEAMRQPKNLYVMRLYKVNVEMSFIKGHISRNPGPSDDKNLAQAMDALEMHRTALNRSMRDEFQERVEKVVKAGMKQAKNPTPPTVEKLPSLAN